MISFLYESEKIQQTSEYNKRETVLTEIENKLVVTSGEQAEGRSKTEVGD